MGLLFELLHLAYIDESLSKVQADMLLPMLKNFQTMFGPFVCGLVSGGEMFYNWFG